MDRYWKQGRLTRNRFGIFGRVWYQWGKVTERQLGTGNNSAEFLDTFPMSDGLFEESRVLKSISPDSGAIPVFKS